MNCSSKVIIFILLKKDLSPKSRERSYIFEIKSKSCYGQKRCLANSKSGLQPLPKISYVLQGNTCIVWKVIAQKISENITDLEK